jgi:DNA polymerase elongation subunit (family B)
MSSQKTIHELIEKYFEGETSASEELQLRQYFRSQEVSGDLKLYKSLFAYIDEEVESRNATKQADSKQSFSLKRKILYITTAVAACVTILLSINFFNQSQQLSTISGGSFAIIDGQYYTNAQLVKSIAFEALKNVAVPTAEYFPDKDFDAQKEIMHEQLRELSNIFTE